MMLKKAKNLLVVTYKKSKLIFSKNLVPVNQFYQMQLQDIYPQKEVDLDLEEDHNIQFTLLNRMLISQ